MTPINPGLLEAARAVLWKLNRDETIGNPPWAEVLAGTAPSRPAMIDRRDIVIRELAAAIAKAEGRAEA